MRVGGIVVVGAFAIRCDGLADRRFQNYLEDNLCKRTQTSELPRLVI